MGAVGGAVYYAGQERIFGTPAETKAAVDKVKKQINECEHLQVFIVNCLIKLLEVFGCYLPKYKSKCSLKFFYQFDCNFSYSLQWLLNIWAVFYVKLLIKTPILIFPQMIPRPEMPELVTSTFGSWKDTSFKRSWNNGVLYTFTAINHLPNTVRELTNYAWEAMNNQGQGQGEEKSGQDKAKSGQDEAKGGQEKKDKKE